MLIEFFLEKMCENLQASVHLNESDKEKLAKKLVFKTLKKKETLNPDSLPSPFCSFVIEGSMRSYKLTDNGFEHILQFAPEGWWIADFERFVLNSEPKIVIEAIEDTSLFIISRENQLELFKEIPKIENHFRIITERALVASQKRLVDLLSLPALDRYNKFCKTYPSLMHSLPQKYIASYIGVTPEFFSKMIKQKNNF